LGGVAVALVAALVVGLVLVNGNDRREQPPQARLPLSKGPTSPPNSPVERFIAWYCPPEAACPSPKVLLQHCRATPNDPEYGCPQVLRRWDQVIAAYIHRRCLGSEPGVPGCIEMTPVLRTCRESPELFSGHRCRDTLRLARRIERRVLS
jgi:hypothetical protein